MSMVNIGGELTTSKLTNVHTEDVQPNAVDLRLAKVLRIKPTLFEIDAANNKKHRETEVIEPDTEGFWYLEPGDYEVVMENEIEVGPDEAGFVITRSTLNRAGIFLTSGLYDSGYGKNDSGERLGAMAGCMHVNVGPAKIQKGTRVGQYLSWKAEALHAYNGSYGPQSEHDKKYL